MAPAARPVPIALVLANGDHCRLRVGGAWDTQKQHPDWAGTYACSGEDAIFAAPRDPFYGIDTSNDAWNVQVGTFAGPLGTVAVTVAYYLTTAS